MSVYERASFRAREKGSAAPLRERTTPAWSIARSGYSVSAPELQVAAERPAPFISIATAKAGKRVFDLGAAGSRATLGGRPTSALMTTLGHDCSNLAPSGLDDHSDDRP